MNTKLQLTDYALLAIKEAKRRKLRSVLTLIGIIIGIAAIISLITLGQGLENAIDKQFAALGKDKLFVAPKGNTLTPGLSVDAIKLTEKDLDVVDDSLGIMRTAGFSFTTGRIEVNDNVRYFIVSGLPDDPEDRALIGEANSYTITRGRTIEKGDRYKAVLGDAYSQYGLFDTDIGIGSNILIQGQEFKVIGFMDKIGSPPDDQSILIPLKIHQSLFGKKDEIGIIVAQASPGESIQSAAATVKKDLRKSRGLSEGKEDFSVETPEQLAATFTTVLDIVQIVLIGIAAISLLVGGIGIMNTMYTAVLQRTKEIGILKAVGATRKDILMLFLFESGVYGFVGGLVGISLGVLLAIAVEQLFITFIGPAFLLVTISIPLILFSLFFSFIVGVISGIAPALQASKQNPVEALRYE